MTRRQFFALLKAEGFRKSLVQMSRNGLNYERRDSEGPVFVTVPKGHSDTFMVLGKGAEAKGINGIFISNQQGWGTYVDPAKFGCSSMLEVCIKLLAGELRYAGPGREPCYLPSRGPGYYSPGVDGGPDTFWPALHEEPTCTCSDCPEHITFEELDEDLHEVVYYCHRHSTWIECPYTEGPPTKI